MDFDTLHDCVEQNNKEGPINTFSRTALKNY